jgi:enamine deaminase RidA (YjgF/YER057c/UK114 family)
MGDKVTYYPEYWGGKKLAYPHVPPESAKLSRSVVVGSLIFLYGCQSANDETMEVEADVFEEQMINALDKIRRAIGKIGSSMNKLVKVLMLFKNREDYPRMRKTELEYYQKYAPILVEDLPASTVMVANLGKPEYLIEIDAIGALSRE